MLERRVIAWEELAVALAAPAEVMEAPVPSPREVPAEKVPVARSIVPQWQPGVTMEALAPDHQRLVELVASEPAEGVRANMLAITHVNRGELDEQHGWLAERTRKAIKHGWTLQPRRAPVVKSTQKEDQADPTAPTATPNAA